MICRTIPCLWLALGFLWYTLAGFVLAYTDLWDKTWAIAGTGAWTLAMTGFTALIWTGALPVAWAFVETGSGSMSATKTIAGVGVVVLTLGGVLILAGVGVWAYALAWSGAWAWAGSWSGAWNLTRILTRTVVCAWASTLASGVLLGVLVLTMPWVEIWVEILAWFAVLAWSVTSLLGVVGVLALTWAVVEDELPKSISQFNTFLILALTSVSGMGFGWLANLICR